MTEEQWNNLKIDDKIICIKRDAGEDIEDDQVGITYTIIDIKTNGIGNCLTALSDRDYKHSTFIYLANSPYQLGGSQYCHNYDILPSGTRKNKPRISLLDIE